jgi:selenocysteine-specific elongation factor
MHVLGTAGHVDHGKSSLVKALSGIDPDRLPEEKARGLTIELGFAWFETEAGPLGVVDVPGHERFVRTMVAGAGGIDIVMLVVAADDGWMPQTQEHLDIIRLLDVKAGLVALTKADLVEDSWLALVEDDIRVKTKDTFLENSPIVRTDALSGRGLEDLKGVLAKLQRDTSSRADLGRGRLSVDRVFTMTGQGTVITGTLRDGSFTKDQQVHLFPTRKTARIRSLQTHKHELDRVSPGSRVATNLAGLDRNEVARGTWLYSEEPVPLPRFVGVELSVLPQAPFPLKPRTQLLVIQGTTEVDARLNLPDGKLLVPGSVGTVQVELLQPLSARFGDRFIVRLPTPQATVGGGRFLDPSLFRYARRHKEEWEGLAGLASGTYEDWVEFHLQHLPVCDPETLYSFWPGSRKDFECALSSGSKTDRWNLVGDRLVRKGWIEEHLGEVEQKVLAFHKANPSEVGPSLAEMLAAVPEDLRADFLRNLESRQVRSEGPYLCHGSHRAGLTATQTRLADLWRKQFEEGPFAGPTRTELLKSSPEAKPTLEFLLKSDELTELKDGVLLRTEDFNNALRLAVLNIQSTGEITVATFRDLIGATRKYALPILDRADRMGYTRRVEDVRVLGPRAGELREGAES